MTYDIAGLKGKDDSKDFLNYVKEHDIFLLYETFVEKKNLDYYEKYSQGYSVMSIPAVRSAIFGGASGGHMYDIRHGLNEIIKFI